FSIEKDGESWEYECRNGVSFVSNLCAGSCFPYAAHWFQIPRVWPYPTVCSSTAISLTFAGWGDDPPGTGCHCDNGTYGLVNVATQPTMDGNCVGGEWRYPDAKDCDPFHPWWAAGAGPRVFLEPVNALLGLGTTTYGDSFAQGNAAHAVPLCGDLQGVLGG